MKSLLIKSIETRALNRFALPIKSGTLKEFYIEPCTYPEHLFFLDASYPSTEEVVSCFLNPDDRASDVTV